MATRIAPVQNRALARQAALRAAAKQAIEEKGIERFTTADIAAISGSSIGTVYRYYDDRVAVLDDLYPNRVTALEPTAANADRLANIVREALAILNDTDLQNPRDRVRGAREALERAGL